MFIMRRYKRRYKRRPFRAYKKRNYSLSIRKLNAKVNAINKANRPDITITDNDASDQDIYTTATVTAIGAAPTKEETVKSIQMKGTLELDSDTADVTHLARIVLFIDTVNTDPDNDTVSFTDVFKTESVIALRTRNSTDPVRTTRYKVIFDRVYSLRRDTDGGGVQKRYFEFYYNKPYRCVVNATAGGGYRNRLYIAYLSTAATTVMDLDYRIRSRFTAEG